MDRTDKAEKTMTNIRHSDPDPPLQACHHRVQSTPAVIVRHHSAPSFGMYALEIIVEYLFPALIPNIVS